MKPKSTKALVWAAVICILLGMVVISPSGSLFLFATAAVFAAIATIFGVKGTRIAAVIVLAASLALVVVTYPKYDAEMTRYRERAKAGSRKGSATQPTQGQERK